MNFLRFHSTFPETFMQKQGLNRTFFQCDNHMWRIGKRSLIYGLQIDGGSDWFCLNRDFLFYVTYSNDEYLNRLKNFFQYTLLPSEVRIGVDSGWALITCFFFFLFQRRFFKVFFSTQLFVEIMSIQIYVILIGYVIEVVVVIIFMLSIGVDAHRIFILTRILI